jgi:hypothetical protein
MIKRITLPDGSKVGIMDLDEIIKEVVDLKLAGNDQIKAELLRRVKSRNYVAPSAEEEYSTALLLEYQVKLGIIKAPSEQHKHTAG